jgi:hypothetical protein
MSWLIAAAVSAADLDAPGQKSVTFRSEAKRGFAAAEGVSSGLAPSGAVKVLDLIEQQNKQNNTDSDGFKLGFNVGACLRMHRFAAIGLNERDAKFANTMAAVYRTKAQLQQRALNIDDPQMQELFGTWTIKKMQEVPSR